jgi:acetyltransferase-like isoleucine patch superfamily enzyme
MNWSAPVSINLPSDATAWNRILTFLGHYDSRFYCSPGAYVDVGAGSLPCVTNLMLVPAGEPGKVGEIGRFCEMHPSARILVRGEHANDRPVNICFSGLPIVHGGFDDEGLTPLQPFTIGNGVVISANAQVLSGRRVGDGAVIGASSVLTKDAEPLGIYAGVPARKLRVRELFAPWWDFDIAYLTANKERLQALAADRSAAHVYRPRRPRFVLRNEGT